MLEELLDGKSDVGCDLSEQRRGDVTASVERDGRATAVCMPVLAMRTALPNLCESEPLKDGHNFPRLQDRHVAH
jgi:hypothetical protein